MIKRFRLLRNIGNFHSVDAGKDIDLGKLTLCYANNGRGKTTLASVLRSLADGNPVPILERKRLGSPDDPHVVIELDDGSPKIVFEDETWNGSLASLAVFDDTFVEQNVYSGLTVSPQQRQELHNLILGQEAVALNKQLDEQVERIEKHNQDLRFNEGQIPTSIRGQFSVDEFCALPSIPNIDRVIQETESLLTAAQDQDAIGTTPAFDLFDLPKFDLAEIELVLQLGLSDLETDAFDKVQRHLTGLGQGGETWVSDGMHRIGRSDGKAAISMCPFCAQNLDESSLIEHYRAYFSDAYSNLKSTIAQTSKGVSNAFGENVQADFERKLRIVSERRQFWGRFCEVKGITLDTTVIFCELSAARDAILSLLNAKQASPLEKVLLPVEARSLVVGYESQLTAIANINQRLQKANMAIENLKEQKDPASAKSLLDKLNCLKSTRIRHTSEIAEVCDAYLKEFNAKSETEKSRDQTREALNRHREIVFPKYQVAVNRYLEKFGSAYRLKDMKHANLRVGSTSTYDAQVGDASIPVGASKPKSGKPSFGSVLSGGDRTTLAFAFFLASLDQRPDLGDTIVVIDDPISSMDTDRSLTTVQEIRSLTSRVAQAIIFSHDKWFLSRIWERADLADSEALEIARFQDGSTLRKWDVSEDSLTEHDRRHKLLQSYFDNGEGDQREVAKAIRPHLEGFLRTACPLDFPPGSSLGNQFLAKCEQARGGARQILSEVRLQELPDILEYAHSFHHDSNPEWASKQVTDGELRTFVGKTLKFTRP